MIFTVFGREGCSALYCIYVYNLFFRKEAAYAACAADLGGIRMHVDLGRIYWTGLLIGVVSRAFRKDAISV